MEFPPSLKIFLLQAIHGGGMRWAREDGRFERGPGRNTISNGEDLLELPLTGGNVVNIKRVRAILRMITILPPKWPIVEKLCCGIPSASLPSQRARRTPPKVQEKSCTHGAL